MHPWELELPEDNGGGLEKIQAITSQHAMMSLENKNAAHEVKWSESNQDKGVPTCTLNLREGFTRTQEEERRVEKMNAVCEANTEQKGDKASQ